MHRVTVEGVPEDGEPPGDCPVCGEPISDWSMANTSLTGRGMKPTHLACAYKREPIGLSKYRAPVRPSRARRKRR